jgi:hypothetical protein|tara:strand:+ start:4382 stop:5230 length:849 start_codon:yes stop_codon:yes gene_type:complete
MVQNTSEIKEKIISIFKRRGPSLPIHISRETELSILFASAFLSELLAEKTIKISNMRVGSSPIYFIPGQEIMLEKFSTFLKSKEKEAFLLLKEKKFLKDSKQEPAIRVALRELKDFAIPFKKNEDIYWKYLNISETELKNFEEETLKEPIKPVINEEKIGEILKKEKRKKILKKPTKTKNSKQNEKFLTKVKDFLMKSSIEINSIENIGKDELVLKVKENGKEKLLFAYNKKRITEKKIVKAGKKASEENLEYSIFFLGILPKKISDFKEALKNLDSIGKLE